MLHCMPQGRPFDLLVSYLDAADEAFSFAF